MAAALGMAIALLIMHNGVMLIRLVFHETWYRRESAQAHPANMSSMGRADMSIDFLINGDLSRLSLSSRAFQDRSGSGLSYQRRAIRGLVRVCRFEGIELQVNRPSSNNSKITEGILVRKQSGQTGMRSAAGNKW